MSETGPLFTTEEASSLANSAQARTVELEKAATSRSLTEGESQELHRLSLQKSVIGERRGRVIDPEEEQKELAEPVSFTDGCGKGSMHGLVSDDEKLDFERRLVVKVPWLSANATVSTVVWFYANNGASSQIPRELVVVPGNGPGRPALTHGSVEQLLAQVSPMLTIRRMMRAYADFARSLLLANPNYMTKMFRKYNMPEYLRHVAFDFAEFCRSPPLSSLERSHTSFARSQILRGQRLHPAVGVPTIGQLDVSDSHGM